MYRKKLTQKLQQLVDKLPVGNKRKEVKPIEGKAIEMNFRTNGTKLEIKSLGITTNQNTDTDYLLSGAELRDSAEVPGPLF